MDRLFFLQSAFLKQTFWLYFRLPSLLIDLQLLHKSDTTQKCNTRWILSSGCHNPASVMTLVNGSPVLSASEYLRVHSPQREECNDMGPILCDWDGWLVLLSVFSMYVYVCMHPLRAEGTHCDPSCLWPPEATLARAEMMIKDRRLDGKMWINEAQIELIAMTSHNSEAAKWEYVVGPPESQRFAFKVMEGLKTEKLPSFSWLP